MESSIRESKADLRLRMKSLREALSSDQVKRWSDDIAQRLLDASLFSCPANIALYASIHQEVLTEGIFTRLKQMGCRIMFPRALRDTLNFVEVSSWDDLKPGSWRIPEPKLGSVVNLEDIEAVLIPGLAFDEAGNRLGFGKGFYDRSLRNYAGLKIGLGYDFQVLPAIPRADHDLVCDVIVTEKRLVRGDSRKESTWNPSLSW